MVPPRLNLLASLVLLMMLCLTSMSCGDSPCRTDYDCPDSQVCEPGGCATACEDSGDCRAGVACVVRRVEEGKICDEARRDATRRAQPDS